MYETSLELPEGGGGVGLLWQHESTTKQDGRHVYFSCPQGMLGQAITMHDVTDIITMHDVTGSN